MAYTIPTATLLCLTALLLVVCIASAEIRNEDRIDKILASHPHHKKKISKSEIGRFLQHKDEVGPQEATAGDKTQSGLESSAKKLGQLYATIRSVVLPQTDTNSQRLVMMMPGKILNYYDYFPGDAYESALEKPDQSGTQKNIPVRVMENMFALADAVPGVDASKGADTGESLAIIYENILNWMQIKGFNEKTQEEKKHYLLAVEYLAQKVPDPFNVSVNVTRYNLYRRAQDEYNARRLDMEDIIANKRLSLPADEYERWFQRNYPTLNARVEAAYTEWLVFGEKEIVELYKSYLDVQAPGIDLENARMALRASGVVSLDRSRTIYPVSFVPSNWYRYLTDTRKTDKVSKRDALSGDQMRIQIGRLKAKRAMLVALKSAPLESTAKTALDDAKNEVTKADTALSKTATDAEKRRQTCLAKRGCQIGQTVGSTVDCGDFTNSSQSATDTIDVNAQIYSCAEALYAQLNPEAQKAYIDVAIASIDEAIKDYTKELASISSVRVSQLAEHAADTQEQLDSNWLQFRFDSASTSQSEDTSTSTTSFTTSVSGKAFFFSGSASVSNSKAEQDFRSQMNNAKVVVSGQLLRVVIQRPWFRPSLFRSAEYLMADNMLVSPGDHLKEKEFVEKAINRTKYLLPHYSTALVLSRNISIEFRELSASTVYHAIQQSTSFSAGFSVGGFWGSASASASGEIGSTSSNLKVESSENGLRIAVPGVQIIGYYTQNVPIFPKV